MTALEQALRKLQYLLPARFWWQNRPEVGPQVRRESRRLRLPSNFPLSLDRSTCIWEVLYSPWWSSRKQPFMSPLDPGTAQSKLGLISYIIAFATWTWVLFVAPAISIIYFRSTRIDAPMRIRILVFKLDKTPRWLQNSFCISDFSVLSTWTIHLHCWD